MAQFYRYTNPICFVCLIAVILINAESGTLGLTWNSTDEFLVEKTTEIAGLIDSDPIDVKKTLPMTNITESRILLSIFSLGIGQLTEYAHAAKLVKDLKANGSTQIEEQYQNATADNNIFDEIAYPSALAALLAMLVYSVKPNYKTAKFVESLPEIAKELCEKNHYAKTYGEGKILYGQDYPLKMGIGEENYPGSNGGKKKTPDTNVGWNIRPENNNMDAPSTNVRNDLNAGRWWDTNDFVGSNSDWNIPPQGDSVRSSLPSVDPIFVPKIPSFDLPKIRPVSFPRFRGRFG